MCAARSVSQAELAHRMEFVGRVADRCIRDRYVGKGVSGLYAPGSANPIRYVKAAYSRKALAEIHRVLEDIELTGEKREWCSNFSFYDPLQDDPYGLENSLNELLDLAYRGGFVPVDYEVVYQSIGKDDIALRKASKKELLELSDCQLVSILGYQFRGVTLTTARGSERMWQMDWLITTSMSWPCVGVARNLFGCSSCRKNPLAEITRSRISIPA